MVLIKYFLCKIISYTSQPLATGQWISLAWKWNIFGMHADSLFDSVWYLHITQSRSFRDFLYTVSIPLLNIVYTVLYRSLAWYIYLLVLLDNELEKTWNLCLDWAFVGRLRKIRNNPAIANVPTMIQPACLLNTSLECYHEMKLLGAFVIVQTKWIFCCHISCMFCNN